MAQQVAGVMKASGETLVLQEKLGIGFVLFVLLTDSPYIGGTVPLPMVGKIGSYAEMSKLTKGYNGAIQAHHLVEVRNLKTLGISKSEAPAINR